MQNVQVLAAEVLQNFFVALAVWPPTALAELNVNLASVCAVEVAMNPEVFLVQAKKLLIVEL